MAIAFLLIIVLQYVENQMQSRELSVFFSNDGPFIKQLDCNFIIREEKKKCCKILLLLVSLILKLFHYSNLINVKMPQIQPPLFRLYSLGTGRIYGIQ